MSETLGKTVYSSLLHEVQELLEPETLQRGEVEGERVQRYWEVGRRIEAAVVADAAGEARLNLGFGIRCGPAVVALDEVARHRCARRPAIPFSRRQPPRSPAPRPAARLHPRICPLCRARQSCIINAHWQGSAADTQCSCGFCTDIVRTRAEIEG